MKDLTPVLSCDPSALMARAGKLRILGLSGFSMLPDFKDAQLLTSLAPLKTFNYSAWASFAVAKSVPLPLATTLHRQLNQILQLPDIKTFAESMGSQIPAPSSLREIEAFYQEEIDRTRTLAHAVRLTAD